MHPEFAKGSEGEIRYIGKHAIITFQTYKKSLEKPIILEGQFTQH